MTNLFSFLALTLGRIIQFVLVFLTIKVMTTLLSPDEVGKYYLILAIISGLLFLFINPVGLFINRRINTWKKLELIRQYLFLYIIYLFLVSLISIIFANVILNYYLNFDLSIYWITALVGCSILFNTINATAIPSLNLLGHPIKYIFLIVFTVTSSLILAAMFVHMFGFYFYYWFIGIIIGQSIIGLLASFILYKNTNGNIKLGFQEFITRKKLKNFFNFLWPISLSASFIWIHFQSYRFIIESYLNTYELGIFVAGFVIGLSLIAATELVLASFLLPKFYKAIETSNDFKKSQSWNLYASTLIPSLLVTGCIVIILAPEITKVFLGPEFQVAVNYVFWGVLCEICRVIFGTYALMAHAKMQTRWLIVPSLIGSIIAVCSSIILIDMMSAHGVGFSMFVAGLLSIIFVHWFINSKISISLNWKSIIFAIALIIALCFFDLCILPYSKFNELTSPLALIILYGVIFFILQYLLLFKTIKNYE